MPCLLAVGEKEREGGRERESKKPEKQGKRRTCLMVFVNTTVVCTTARTLILESGFVKLAMSDNFFPAAISAKIVIKERARK